MKEKDLHKFSKIYLYERLVKLEKGIRANVKAGKLTEHSTDRMKCEYKKIKRYIYECKFCTDADVDIITNVDGNEIELLKHDCKKQHCKYHDQFYELWSGKIPTIDKLIANVLK